MRTRLPVISIFVVILFSAFAHAEDGRWDKVRYNGGTLQSKVDPHDWNNHLSVNSTQITLDLKDGQYVTIPVSEVTGLSYGQEAHRRVSAMFVLFGLFHKTRVHYIGLEYTVDGKKSAVLLQGDKDNYREILTALEQATHAPFSVSEKDRSFVPDTMRATVVKDSDARQSAAAPAAPIANAAPKPEAGTVSLTSNPVGALVYVDDNLAGKTPCTLSLDPGKHTVKVIARQYQTWLRELRVREGSEHTLNAKLEK